MSLANFKEIRSYDIFERKFEHDVLLQKYSAFSGMQNYINNTFN